MQLRLAGHGRPRPWSVDAPRGTTLGALAALGGFASSSFVAIDGWVLPATCTLDDAGVIDGMLIAPAAAPAGTGLALVVEDGTPGGRRVPLTQRRCTVGRHPANDVCLTDPEVRARHADLEVTEHGAVHVTLVGQPGPFVLGAGGELVLGATRVRVEVVAPAFRALTGADGREGAADASPPTGAPPPAGRPPAVVALRNRPPRPAPAPWPAAPIRPADPRPPSRSATLRTLVTMLVPALAGVVLAAVLRPDFLALALLAPAGALATWLVLLSLDVHAARTHRAEVLAADVAHAAVCHTAADAQRDALHVRHPHLDDVAARVVTHDVRLWERRPAHDDFLRVPAGLGQVRCDALAGEMPATIGAPVELDLRTPIGITGDPQEARALARALVLHVAAHHGPADVSIRAWSTDPCSWQWLTWLPHAPDLAVCSAADAVDDDALDAAGSRSAEWSSAPAAAQHLIVLDASGVPAAWRPAWRQVVDRVAAIVVAPAAHDLPEQCRVVVHLSDGMATVHDLTSGGRTTVHEPWLLTAERAEALAARLAPLRDPDTAGSQELPRRTGLLALVDHHGGADADALQEVVARRWATARRTGRAAAPIGTSAHGPLEIDLDADGPHALVAGTTGAGKSELLRSLVLSLAASIDPQHLAFVLVDYKGGSAFDGLQALPHVVDVVTDLDASAADRARRGLDAEVLRREQVLRAVGVGDLAAYHATVDTGEPLPRLVIVVDEFATLAHEMSSFVDALVDVAQRGRSLGIHLVLATQRPGGAVKDSIRTNTNLRVALRVLDAHDSRDVLGVDDAATIPRRCHGRAIARLGAGELRTFQSAYTGGPVEAAEPDRLRMAPVGLPRAPAKVGMPSELDMLVRAVNAAHRAAGGPAPRRPWTDPLPSPLPYSAIDPAPGEGGLLLGLLDDPEAQAHRTYVWAATGNLLVAGLAGNGASDVVATCIASASGRSVDARPHVYVIAANAARHEWAETLSHVGAVVATADAERVMRLLRMLAERVDARRLGKVADAREALVLVDGIGALRAEYDTVTGLEALERLERLAADGPGVGVRFAFVADHPGDLGHRLDRTVSQRVFLRLGDRADYLSIGRRDIDPALLPHGRGVDAATGHTVQLAHLDAVAMAALARRSSSDPDSTEASGRADPDSTEASGRADPDSTEASVAPSVGSLPVAVERSTIGRPTVDTTGVLQLPLGIGDTDLAPVGVALGAGEHLLVAGGPRRAKSALLATVQRALGDAGITTVVLGAARTPLPGALRSRADITTAIDALLASTESGEPQAAMVVLVDDADAVDDGGAIERLVTAGPAHVHVIAAARTDRLRPLLRHWTTELRRGGHAVLLRGDDADADLVGVRLPRNITVRGVGRGWLVRDGDVERCQFALDPAGSACATAPADPVTSPPGATTEAADRSGTTYGAGA